METKNSWLELSINVPNKFVALISEIFFIYGVSSIQNIETKKEKTTLITYFKNKNSENVKIKEINDLLSEYPFEGNILSTKKILETDWVQKSRDSFEPIEIGKKLWIKPSWNNKKAPKGRIEIILDPGSSFGTGKHPTTRLALLSIEDFLLKNDINHFLDVGCGSGILMVAALKLGAKRGIAFDIDSQAVENTKKLLCLNRVSKRAKVINDRLHTKYLGLSTGKINFILANIFLSPLQEIFPLFGEILNLKGRLLITGITRKQCKNFTEICRDFNLKLLSKKSQSNWSRMEFEKI